MKTYWDYTERERAELTEAEVGSMLDVELMSKGVLKVAEPVLRPTEAVNIPTTMYFECGDVIFTTAEQAAQFFSLNPMRQSYDYNVGYDYKYAQGLSGEIKQVKLFNLADLTNLKNVLTKNNEAEKHNKSAREEFEKAMKKVNQVTEGVWQDWCEQKRTAARHQKLMDTMSEYMVLTKNDDALANTFLLKVYTQEDIDDAKAWLCGIEKSA